MKAFANRFPRALVLFGVALLAITEVLGALDKFVIFRQIGSNHVRRSASV